MERWTFALIVFGVVAVLTALWLFGFARWRGPRRGRALRALGVCCAALYALVAAEVVCGQFVAVSDGYGVTRAGYRWFQKHFKVNSFGYRDVEPSAPAEGERVLLVLGDSLMAGHGIPRVEDRFADQVARALGAGWRVPVAARPGWNTGEETQALEGWPFRVDRVLLTYTLTDIETAANDVGRARPEPAIEPPPALVRPLVDHSFVCNWVYWRYLRNDFGTRYPDFLGAMYADPEVWAAHEARLTALIAAARAKGAPEAELRVLLWPDLPRLDACAGPFAQVREFFERRGVPVLDLTDRFRGRDPRGMMINPLDEHPNEGVQAEVARWVATWLAE